MLVVCLAPETCHLTRSRFRVCVDKKRLQNDMFEKTRPLDTHDVFLSCSFFNIKRRKDRPSSFQLCFFPPTSSNRPEDGHYHMNKSRNIDSDKIKIHVKLMPFGHIPQFSEKNLSTREKFPSHGGRVGDRWLLCLWFSFPFDPMAPWCGKGRRNLQKVAPK